ncbi:MAG: transposase [Deltaproteobacteria bacterium]|jgi:transposase|nr:transposase [Deltaproteobacteria bacterium]
MARPVDPNAQYRVKTHVNNGYTYASTQPSSIDPVTGKKKFRYKHWGRVDENLKFIPGQTFYLASTEERARLVFPEGWDMSEAVKFSGLKKPGRPTFSDDCENRLYGDVWLLEKIAEKTGIRRDLEKVFSGNREIVDDLLTLAMFPYLTKFTYNRVARWQRIVRSPSSRELTPSAITRLTQSVTERHRMDLLKLRSARLGKDELCSVDSTSRSAYGDSLADIRWGKNKENLPLEQTMEVVVYTLSSHMPVYYRTFPGNMPDSRSLGVILTDLGNAGFKNLVLITDRGYETLRNLERLISLGQSVIMCANTSQKDVSDAIARLGEFSARPEAMRIDSDAKLYYSQHDIEYEVESAARKVKESKKLRLYLYFDSIRRSRELMELDIALSFQEIGLKELFDNKNLIEDINNIKNDFSYYDVILDDDTNLIKSFELNLKKVAKARKFSGFFSIITHGLDFDAMRIFNTYRLRDEQEKYFQQMKDQMVSDRQRNWSEEGKTGRLFILFVSLILGSYVRHIWKSTKLHDIFSSSLDIVDEMRSIRFVEYANKAKMITPFIGAQLDICEAFGFEIPDGCSPLYKSRKIQKRKRGRPPKKKVENSL